jgi:hypothetical protein
MVHPDFEEFNPLRQPDGRWRRAVEIVQRRLLLLTHTEDADVVRAIDYLRKVDSAKSPDCTLPSSAFADVHAARHIAEQGGLTKDLREAHILARRNDDTIAALLHIPARVVEIYEALYFHVRDRLECSDWIASNIIGPGLHRGFAPDESAQLWKAFAYFEGPLVLDRLLDVALDRPLTTSLQVPEGQDPDRYEERIRLSVRLAIAVRMRNNAKELQRLYRLKRRLDLAALGKNDRPDPQLDRMLATLAGPLGKSRPRSKSRSAKRDMHRNPGATDPVVGDLVAKDAVADPGPEKPTVKNETSTPRSRAGGALAPAPASSPRRSGRAKARPNATAAPPNPALCNSSAHSSSCRPQ